MKIKTENVINWSRTKSYNSQVIYPTNYEELKEIIKNNENKTSIAFKASGCSYGDCYLNKSGKLINLKYFNKIISFNSDEESLLVQCAVRMEDLLNYIIPKGYYLNSVPGSNNATVGGCINSNVHGKDTFLHGVFGNNVISLKVMDCNGEILNLDKKNDRLFYAIGTFGLTYLILEAKLKITKIKSPLLNVSTIKFSNYFEMLNLFKKFKDQNSQMMGVWIDHFDKRGKGIFKAAKWSNKNNAEFKKINFTKGILKNIYISFFYPVIKILLVNRPAMKIFNFLLYNLTTQKEQLSHFVDFYFPQQKFLSEESKLYSGGKINIQLLVPEKDAEKILINISELCNKFKMESWWLGIKKHIKDKFILVYALDGYDITLQWSQKYLKKRDFNNFYSALIQLIIKNNCLVYLTQDILLNKNDFEKIYKDHKIFCEIKNNIDTKKIFRNDLYNRLFNLAD